MRRRSVMRIFIIPAIICFFMALSIPVGAQSADLDKEARKKKIAQAKKELEGTVWEISLTQMGTTNKSEDTITFTEGKVESRKLTDEGFSPTNFTVSLKENEIIVWETMQSSEDEGLAFWRAEISGGRMRGVLSRHISENRVKDYTFASEVKKDFIGGEATEKTEEQMEDAERTIEQVVEQKPEESIKEAQASTEEAKEDSGEEKIKVKESEETDKIEEPEKEEKKWWQR